MKTYNSWRKWEDAWSPNLEKVKFFLATNADPEESVKALRQMKPRPIFYADDIIYDFKLYRIEDAINPALTTSVTVFNWEEEADALSLRSFISQLNHTASDSFHKRSEASDYFYSVFIHKTSPRLETNNLSSSRVNTYVTAGSVWVDVNDQGARISLLFRTEGKFHITK